MKVLLDTNILIDYIAKRNPYYSDARQIILLCTQKKFFGCIAAHSVMNTFYILRNDLSVQERRDSLKDICYLIPVIGIDTKKIISALDNYDFSDVEDCLQVECAKEFTADYIVTRNIKDFKKSTIPAILPDDFLKLV